MGHEHACQQDRPDGVSTSVTRRKCCSAEDFRVVLEGDQLASEFCQLLIPITRVGVHLCKWTFYEFDLDEPVAKPICFADPMFS